MARVVNFGTVKCKQVPAGLSAENSPFLVGVEYDFECIGSRGDYAYRVFWVHKARDSYSIYTQTTFNASFEVTRWAL